MISWQSKMERLVHIERLVQVERLLPVEKLVQMERLSWVRVRVMKCWHLEEYDLCVSFESNLAPAPPHDGVVRDRGPLYFPSQRWGLPTKLRACAPMPEGYGFWGVLRSTLTSPYPGVTRKLAARAQPVSASGSAGRGPRASEGRAGPEPGAGSGEQGRKRIPPAHSGPPVGTQRQSMLLAGLLWNLKLPCCWGAGNFLWNLVSQTTKLQGFVEASWGKILPRTQGPIVGASWLLY